MTRRAIRRNTWIPGQGNEKLSFHGLSFNITSGLWFESFPHLLKILVTTTVVTTTTTTNNNNNHHHHHYHHHHNNNIASKNSVSFNKFHTIYNCKLKKSLSQCSWFALPRFPGWKVDGQWQLYHCILST